MSDPKIPVCPFCGRFVYPEIDPPSAIVGVGRAWWHWPCRAYVMSEQGHR